MKDASVVDILEEILKGIPLSYRMVDNVIVITPRELKEETPKKIVITGTVKEKGGDILPGVTVLLKGTAIGLSLIHICPFDVKSDKVLFGIEFA